MSMVVDHLIIGAGLAGLMLKRMLAPGLKTVIIDHAPGSWKIGEANVPELFDNPVLKPLLDDVRQLPSYSPKDSSLFVGSDSVAIYPVVSNGWAGAHIGRDELEQLFIRKWAIDISIEKVQSIDLDRGVVVTNENTYEVSRQIIDCSGGAMVVARMLGQISKLWPIDSSWCYYDIVENDDQGFWQSLRRTNRNSLAIDIPQLRLVELDPGWSPSRSTALTQVGDGEWLWQIALFNGTMLSAGVVTRHGPVSQQRLDEIVQKHHLGNYTLRARRTDGAPPYDMFHQRSGFALRAERAATTKYILVGDAYMFVDPVYSVGTTVAVNKAFEVAMFLNANAWTEANARKFSDRYEALLRERMAAFQSWYSTDTLLNDPNTARVQSCFPQMTPFQAGISWQYAKVVAATLRQSDAVRRSMRAAPNYFSARDDSRLA